MKKLLVVLFVFSFIQLFAQDDTDVSIENDSTQVTQSNIDKLELKDGSIIYGKVIKIKTLIVEFKESDTDLLYEYNKNEISYIQLSTGKILTFKDVNTIDTSNMPQQPIAVEDEGTGLGVIILAVIGGVLGFLLLLGAIAN